MLNKLLTVLTILSFIAIVFISGYMLREYLGNKCAEKCYNYCDEAKAGIGTIIDQLNNFELTK